MAVPYTFGSATSSIPLSQLDSNFATTITLGNTAVQLGNTITNLTGVSNLASATSLTLGSNGNTTAVTIDTAQNVGIGVTPSAWGSSYRAFNIQQFGSRTAALYGGSGVTGIGLAIGVYNDNTNFIYSVTGAPVGGYLINGSGNHLWFIGSSGTAGTTCTFTQAMTLDNSGNLLVNNSGGTDRVNINFPGNTQNGISVKTTYASLGSNYLAFYNSAGTNTGTINQNGTTTVAYSTSSDYRLKENIVPMTGALATVAQLKPVTYKWKSDGSDGQGFIAHELQAIVPDCVTGEKDAVETYTDEDGNEQTRPKYQGIDTSFLVATLTGAIQELKAINDTQAETINALTARIVALEAK